MLSTRLFAAWLAVCGATVQAEAWRARLPATDTNHNEGCYNIVVDPTGDAVAVGNHDFHLVAVSISPLGAENWRTQLGSLGAGGMAHAAFTASEDVIVAGDFLGSAQTNVHRLASATGAPMWHGSLDVPTDQFDASGIAVDGAGDVYAIGTLVAAPERISVVKLDGASGNELWRYLHPSNPSLGRGQSVIIDAGGDVVVAGWADATFEVAKLSAVDGSELWQYSTPTGLAGASLDATIGLAAVAGGDVFVAFAAHSHSTSAPSALARLAGGSGTESWRATFTSVFHDVVQILVPPDGDPVVAHGKRNPFGHSSSVAKVNAATGAILWQQVLDVGPLGIDQGGDVLAVGFSFFFPRHNEVLRLSNSTGAALATERFGLEGTTPRLEPTSVALHPQGVVIGGAEVEPGMAFVVYGAGDRLRTRKIVMKDPVDPADRRLRLVAKDAWFALPLDGTPASPTAAGATLEIENPLTMETVTLPLPAANWISRPSSEFGGTIYKYSDPLLAAGPCKTVVLRGNSTLKVKCDGPASIFTLDEAMQGALDIRLTVPGGFNRCFSSGGPTVVDEPGRYIAKNGNPPASCTGGF